ncbi:calcium-dependent protein kinase 31-like [Haliotis rufescens]|uniref:calcium-dependent protein kinase 31-like n=1 Tax=Haliotis rufescens TaxID=6454 RepID=UPI00201EC527|nr:calcium-dependent protein kinase 31-like [Haliotis rufescens]
MIVFLVLIGSVAVYGKHYSCNHTNHDQLLPSQVISNVIADIDTDGDGIVEPTEVQAEFVARYDVDKNGSITEEEFVKQWHRHYLDVRNFVGYLFHNFDVNNDNSLTDSDLVALSKNLDTDGNGEISIAEFRTYMMNLYTNCVTAHAN